MKAVLAIFFLGACSFAGANSPDVPDGPEPDGTPSDPNDVDSDGRPNDKDNCPKTANADQADGDSDGVGNVCDNCPTVANPRLLTMGEMVQRDHDLDGRGDACDLCPHIASVAPDNDADGDGIGTACDPNDAEKNAPAEFDGFYDPPSASKWFTPTVGDGAFSDWELVQTPDKRSWWRQKTLDVARHQLIRNRPNIREASVDTMFRVDSIAPAGGATAVRGVAVTYGHLIVSGQTYYFSCGIRHDTGNNADTAAGGAYQNDTPRTNELQETAWTGAVMARDIHVVGVSTFKNGGGGGDSDLACKAVAADPATTLQANNDSQLFPDGKVGLRTFGMTALFDYIFIVDRAKIP